MYILFLPQKDQLSNYPLILISNVLLKVFAYFLRGFENNKTLTEQNNACRKINEIFLIHTYINNLYDIFEEQNDNDALKRLDQIERECC